MSTFQTVRKTTTASKENTSSGKLLLIHAWTPHAGEGGEAKWHKIPAGLNSSVSWYGGPLSADQCNHAAQQWKVNGKLPDALPGDNSGDDGLALRHNVASFPNLKLDFTHGEELASGCGFGVYCLDGDNLTDMKQYRTDDVMDVLHLAQKVDASNICILTQSPARIKIAELVGSCKGCRAGHGFHHLNAGTTNCLLDLQCHACGRSLTPEGLRLAGYTCDMQLQILNSDGYLEDHGVPQCRATDNVQMPDHFPIASGPSNSIRELRITLCPNSTPVPNGQVFGLNLCSVAAGAHPGAVAPSWPPGHTAYTQTGRRALPRTR